MPAPALSLLLSKAFILAQMTVCPLPDFVPKADVFFKPVKPLYVSGAPSVALGKAMRGNPDATHVNAENSKWRVAGMTEASVGGGNYKVSWLARADQQGNTCLYVDTVTFELAYKPNIYIAEEVSSLPCLSHVTRLHEQRHVAADLKLIKEYIPKIKMEILWYLRGLGAQGPYPQQEAKKNADRIVQEVMAAVKPMVERLAETRRQRQGDIDTVENYKYENSLCPGERPVFKK